jgi:hypothetical protein
MMQSFRDTSVNVQTLGGQKQAQPGVEHQRTLCTRRLGHILLTSESYMFALQLHGATKIGTLKQQSKAVVSTQSTEAGAELNESDLEQVQGGINWGDGRIDLGCAKTKSDLVVARCGGQVLAFFCSSA